MSKLIITVPLAVEVDASAYAEAHDMTVEEAAAELQAEIPGLVEWATSELAGPFNSAPALAVGGRPSSSRVTELVDQIHAPVDFHDPDTDTYDEEAAASHYATLALALADAVKVDTVRVSYAYSEDGRTTKGELTLPSWCSGDPAAGVALYLFGYADAVRDLHIFAKIEA